MLMLSLSVIGFSACRSPHFNVAIEKHAPGPTQHWIQEDEMRSLMERLGAKTAEHWPATIPDDPEDPATSSERKEAFKSSAKLASALADAAEQIPHMVEKSSLSDADRNAFIGTAQVLSDQARKLNRAARRHNVEEMQRLLDATRATCISCHTRFKDISGTLPPRA